MSFTPHPQPPRSYSVVPQESVLSHGEQHRGSVVGEGGDDFLDQAKGIELTKEDRQEGYDPSLLALQPRVAHPDPVPSSDPSSTRTKTIKLPSSSAYETHEPSKSTKPGGRGRSGASRRKKKKLAWYQRPIALVVIVGITLVAALGVGLGVGLGKKSGGGGDSGQGTKPSVSAPAVSQSGGGGVPTVQVSAAQLLGVSATASGGGGYV